MRKTALLFASAAIFAESILLTAQTAPNVENGFKSYGSYEGSSIDTINTLNGNQMLHVPLIPGYTQRGAVGAVQYFLYQTSKTWQLGCQTDAAGSVTCVWNTTWPGVAPVQSPLMLTLQRTVDKNGSGTGQVTYQDFGYSLTDQSGSTHWFAGFDTIDTSGYHLVMSNPDSITGVNNTATIIDRHGNQYVASFPSVSNCGAMGSNNLGSFRPGISALIDDAPMGDQYCPQATVVQQVTDSNGNWMTSYAPVVSGGVAVTGGVNIDTLGRAFPSLIGSSTTTTDYSGCKSGHTIASAVVVNYNAPDGSTRPIKLCLANIAVTSAYNSGALDIAVTQPQLVSVVQGDGSAWTFDYDNYGEVTYVALPTGGSLSYTWTTIPFPSCSQWSTYGADLSRSVVTRTINDDNGHSYTWNYSWGALDNNTISNTVTDPLGNETVHVFTALDGAGFGGCGFFETRTQSYQGSGSSRTLLKQVDTTYSWAEFAVGNAAGQALGNVVPTNIQTTVYPSGKVSTVTKSYDSGPGSNAPIFGNVVTEKEYDWGQGSPGNLLRETDTTYQWQNDSRYLTAHLLDLPATVIVKDGSGCAFSETDYTYDESAYLTASNITTQHGAAPNPVRGNLTTVTKWVAPTSVCNPKSGATIVSHTDWYDTGEVYQQIDPLGRTTTHSYDPAYIGAYSTRTCSPSTNAGATAHCVSGTYDFNTGVLTSFTNENATQQANGNTPGDSAHTSNYTYDLMWRLTSAQAPPDPANGNSRATHTFTYSTPNVFPLTLTAIKSVTSTQSDSATATFDGFGRPFRTQHLLPNGTAEVDTVYDALGRVASVTNPYFSTSDPTYGTTQTAYDALGRATQVTEQDKSVRSVSYSQGACANGDDTTTADEAGNARRTCADALGRLIEVDEPGDPIVNFNGAAAPTSGVYSMAGFPDNSGEHDLYVGADQHIYQLFLSPAGWVNQDLTAYTSGGLAAAGSALTSFTDGDGEHLLYVGANQHLYQMYFSYAQWQWYNQDLTASTGNTLASVATGLSSFSDSAGEHVMYVSTSQHIYQLFYSRSTGWQNQDITATAGSSTLAANATGLSSFSDPSGTHVIYEGADQHVYQLYLASSGWFNQDLTGYANGPLATLPTALGTAVDSNGEHVFYFGANQHVDQLAYNATNGWTSQDLTALTENALAATGSSLSSFVDNAGVHVFYQGTNQHINQLYFSVTQAQWYNQDLTAGTVSAGTNGGGVAAFADSQGEHVFYDNGQQVNELVWNGTAWQFANAGGPSLAENFFVTQYGYDALGNLLNVNQKGDSTVSSFSQWRVRSFTYDTLGRLLTATNPESGTISYSYDANGNVLQKTSPQANQTGSATQTVSYCYDELNRPTGKAYSAQSCQGTQLPNGTAVVSYVYDQGTNAKGKLTSLADQAGSAAYAYDVLGRMATEQRVLAGVTKNMSYGYNLDSSLKTVTYPSGATVTYAVDSAGRDVSAVDSANGINYATAAGYDAASDLTGFVSGNSGSFAGITNSFSFNKRLQPVNMSASVPSQTVFSLGYDFHFANGDNGNVFAITNYKDNSRNQSFTYDSLNRLTSAQNAGTNCSATTANGKTEYWGNTYGYDAWGNLLAKTVTKCSAESLSVTADANDHLQGGYTYDAAGNMLHDATSGWNYTYDQENRITGAAGYAYTYDGDGNRVEKSNGSTGTLYWYMSPGIVAESDLGGNLQSEYVFFDGERVARKDFPGLAVSYYFSDHLKTTDIVTDASGNIKNESDFYPWGGELEFLANDSNHYKFTGKERDAETNLDYFGARYYSNGLGRFITPDWAAKATAVPYAEFADPQSLNLYSYVRNIPTSKADADGHCPPCVVEEETGVIIPEEEAIGALATAGEGEAAAATAGVAATATVGSGLVLSTIGLAAADVVGIAYIGHELAHPSHTVGQSNADEIAERDRLDAENAQKAEPAPASGGAMQGNGRGGKQAKLRELGKDDKVSSADRGEIKRDQNQIARGTRSTIRVPGNKDLAHRRGKEARKGHGYKHSDLQSRDLHRLQHKHEGYK